MHSLETNRQANAIRKEIREITEYLYSISPKLARHAELRQKRAMLQKKLNALQP